MDIYYHKSMIIRIIPTCFVILMAVPTLFLIWPALHLMYGTQQHRSDKIDIRRRWAGRSLLTLAFLLAFFPYGWEQGLFYLLFTLMGCAVLFVQLRIWQPNWVIAITSISLLGGVYAVSAIWT